MTITDATPDVVVSVERWAEAHPGTIAVRRKQHGIWLETTWAELDAQVVATSRGLRSIGVTKGDTVAILGENSLDWLVADLAIRRTGAVVLPLSTRASVEQLAVWLTQRSVSVAFCGDQEHVDKIIATAAAVGTLVPSDATGLGRYTVATVISQADLREAGSAAAEHPAEVNSLAAVQPTSAGLVEIADAALESAAASTAKLLGLSDKDRVVAIAPFSEAVARSTDVYATLLAGAQLHIPETLTSVPEDLQQVMPTVLAGPRRVFELLHHESLLRARETGRLRRRLIAWGLKGDRPGRGLRAFMVTRPIARLHGLSQVRWAVVTGDERLPRGTAAWLGVLAVPVVHAWGSAAAGGIAIARTASDSEAVDLAALSPSDRARAAEWASQVDGSAATSGSIALVEAELRENLCIRRAVVQNGDAIVELDLEATANWAADHGIDFGTRASLTSNPAITELVKAEAMRVNAAVGTTVISRIAIAPREFSVTEGDLSPTLEVDRVHVLRTFANRPNLLGVNGDSA